MLLEDVVKEFVFELQVKNYTERTVKGYKNNILKFMEYCKQEFDVDTGIRNLELCTLGILDVKTLLCTGTVTE